MIALRVSQILTPTECIAPGLLFIENGVIRDIVRDMGQSLEGMEVIDAPGCALGPGMIDMHTHGIGGLQAIDGNPQDLEKMSEFYARHGTTGFLSTVSGLGSRIEAGIAATLRSKPQGAEILGFHMEGPFINPARSGAFPLDTIVAPDLALLKKYIDMAQGQMRLITLAPELAGAMELVRYARQAGVLCSAGHSQATWEQMMAAIDAGVSHATHTFNAMPALNHRTPGILGAALADDRLTVEVIADGIHVHPAVVKILLRSKGPGRVVMVSDSIGAAGLPDGDYCFEDLEITVANHSARLASGNLAGSVITLEHGLANLVKFGGITLMDALQIASQNPAIELGMAGRKGSLAPGKDADVICLNGDLVLQWTMARGRLFKPEPQVD